ncbi:hypothetical protein TS85_10290 [Sphingomonas hengshuiensis]|uniref:DNA-binding response regulator n=1 Tax=Sphingomonas hengshuiensis TaxID=1609977 RepID=A0A7U5BFP6_9SPHN|nr:hypothetical protein TS85_10290 [Sphingomonas hengshuiensis]
MPKPVTAQPDPIRALVVDDEAPARRRITDLLARDGDVAKILTAENGADAIAKIREERPDIVFLDMQMPGVNGLGVIEAIGAEAMPVTIFVTAYDRFAIQAFESNAIDYLLKPFSDQRFDTTIARAKERLNDLRLRNADSANALGHDLVKLVAQRAKPGAIWHWIVVKSRDTTRLLMTDQIDWIEAAGVYVNVHSQGEAFLCRASLTTVASRLDPFRFVRIHRSSIVNIRSIAALERRSHGEFEVQLQNGDRLMMSRTYRSEVEALLGQPL